MDILVDNQPCPVEVHSEDRFGAFMERLERALAADGRAVLSVAAADEDLTPARRRDLAGVSLRRMCPIRILTGEPQGLVVSVLRAAAGALVPLGTEQERVVEALQAGRQAQAMAAFRQCVEAWQLVQETLSNVMPFMEAVGFEPGGTADVAAPSDALRGALERVRDALKAGDTSALGDIIEADLIPLAETWQRVLTDLADRAEQ